MVEVRWICRAEQVHSLVGSSWKPQAHPFVVKLKSSPSRSRPNFVDEVITPLREFCGRSIDAWAIGEGALLPAALRMSAVGGCKCWQRGRH